MRKNKKNQIDVKEKIDSELTFSFKTRDGKKGTFTLPGTLTREKYDKFFHDLETLESEQDIGHHKKMKIVGKLISAIECTPSKICSVPTNFELELEKFQQSFFCTFAKMFKNEPGFDVKYAYNDIMAQTGVISQRGKKSNDEYLEHNLLAVLKFRPQNKLVKALYAYWEARYFYRTRITNLRDRTNRAWAALILATASLNEVKGMFEQEDVYNSLIEKDKRMNAGRREGGQKIKDSQIAFHNQISQFLENHEPANGWKTKDNTAHVVASKMLQQDVSLRSKYNNEKLAQYIKKNLSMSDSTIYDTFERLKAKRLGQS